MNVERVRRDFTVLRDSSLVYFDSACMSLKPDSVVKAMVEYYYEFPSCALRSSHAWSRVATEKVFEVREKFSKFIGSENSVVFTRNTTEGLNIVYNGLSLKRGDVVVTSDVEHNSNLLPVLRLKEREGVVHKVFHTDRGVLDFERFEEFLKTVKGLKLVSLVHTSNVFGTTIPAKKIVKLVHDLGGLVLLDSAQTVPHQKVNVSKLGVDFLCFSVHKMLGPTGLGVLYLRDPSSVKPLLVGGETVVDSTFDSFTPAGFPHNFEAGLQDYAGIIGGGCAVDYLRGVGLKAVEDYEKRLGWLLVKGLKGLSGVELLSPDKKGLVSGVVSFNVSGLNPHLVSAALDEFGFMVRSGRHCVHSWFNANNVDGCVRVSLYLYNTKEEVERFLQVLEKIIKDLRV